MSEQETNRSKENRSGSSAGNNGKKLETKGPAKDKDFKVLNKDGSLADDLPGKGSAGSGALEGTVGLGN
jgi:hypothetical protein